MSIYYEPEAHGLAMIGEVEEEPDYDFDKFVVWRRLRDDKLVYGTDSGCSCPSPFESTSPNDLIEILTYDEFNRALLAWINEQYGSRRIDGEAELRSKVREALTPPVVRGMPTTVERIRRNY